MPVLTCATIDGGTLVFDRQGTGSPLLLLHGFGQDRMLWHNAGWVDRLAAHFTVITVDLRGAGTSFMPIESQAYGLDLYQSDIQRVLKTCGYSAIQLFGWSFGGTLGLQLLANMPEVRRAVIAGTFVGQIFTPERIEPQIAQFSELATAKQQGRLAALNVTPSMQAFVERTNMPAYLARLRGCMTWPILSPSALTKPFLLYTSTGDGYVVDRVREQQDALTMAGGTVQIFADLNHRELVTARDQVEASVLAFLQQPTSET
ncbi:alpha/beta fold hydrolase [Herpetosiphon llansteffanensis]|uniref:alpha/beta fold hydrolase n=1 Tax=Herpetosiphon llansteffanensis TaxID=2094568 RepID=UPI000D7C5618|nr:alpha/beta hydrolase [Herpetosiphon llansteffanensis]